MNGIVPSKEESCRWHTIPIEKDVRNSVLFSQGTNTEHDVLFPVDGNAVPVHGILIREEKVFLIQYSQTNVYISMLIQKERASIHGFGIFKR
jgi:hypothetical protein